MPQRIRVNTVKRTASRGEETYSVKGYTIRVNTPLLVVLWAEERDPSIRPGSWARSLHKQNHYTLHENVVGSDWWTNEAKVW